MYMEVFLRYCNHGDFHALLWSVSHDEAPAVPVMLITSLSGLLPINVEKGPDGRLFLLDSL